MKKNIKYMVFFIILFMVSGCETFRTIQNESDEWLEQYEKGEKKYRKIEGKFGKDGIVKVQNGYDEYLQKWIVIVPISSNTKVFKGKEEYGKGYLSPGEDVDVVVPIFKDETTIAEVLVKVYEYDKEKKDVIFRYSYEARFHLYWDRRSEIYIANR